MERAFLCMPVLAWGKGQALHKGLHGVVGFSRGKGSGCPAVEVGRGRLPSGKGRCSRERKSFRMERGLAEPGSHPSPSLGIGRSACGEAEPWERGEVWGKTASNLNWAAAGNRLTPGASLQLTRLFVFPLGLGNAVLPRWKPVRWVVARSLLGTSLRNDHFVSKQARIQGKLLKLTALQECGGFAASPPPSLNHRLWELCWDLQPHKEFYKGMT